jgi:hypothetical protein
MRAQEEDSVAGLEFGDGPVVEDKVWQEGGVEEKEVEDEMVKKEGTEEEEEERAEKDVVWETQEGNR